MKYISKAFFCITLLFVFAEYAEAQDYRDVYWLHGMNGDNTRWERYAERFGGANGDRQMNSTRPEFTTIGSVDGITTAVAGEFNDNPDNIGIGASLGGIVLRNLEVLDEDPSELGGVITVHSPNQGSSMARSVNNGSMRAFLDHVTRTLTKAVKEIDEHLSTEIALFNAIISKVNFIFAFNPITQLVVLLVDGEFFFDPLINDAEIPSEEEISDRIGVAFDLLSSPDLQQIFTDMDPTSGYMDDLNNYPSTLPRIEIHGYEENKEPFRMQCSLEKAVWTDPLAESAAIPDGDCAIFDELDKSRSQLNTAQLLLNAKAILNLSNPVSWIRKKSRPNNLYKAANNVGDAKALVGGGIVEGWGGLLTGFVPVTKLVTQMTAPCAAQVASLEQQLTTVDVLGPEGLAILQQIQQLNQDDACFEEVEVMEFENDPSARHDGLFLDAEQVSGNAMLTLLNEPINGNGVNHVEMLNHPSTWNNLNKIFDDEQSFFHTPPR